MVQGLLSPYFVYFAVTSRVFCFVIFQHVSLGLCLCEMISKMLPQHGSDVVTNVCLYFRPTSTSDPAL